MCLNLFQKQGKIFYEFYQDEYKPFHTIKLEVVVNIPDKSLDINHVLSLSLMRFRMNYR